MTESRQIDFHVTDWWWSIVYTLLSVMLSIAVLTNEVCTAWSDAFFVFASNGSTVWLCLVKSVSFISLGGRSNVVMW